MAGKARALYDLHRGNDGELVFSAGDVITVLSWDTGSPEWGNGLLSGKTGFFPIAYVEKIAQEEVEDPKEPSIPPPVVVDDTEESTEASSENESKEEPLKQVEDLVNTIDSSLRPNLSPGTSADELPNFSDSGIASPNAEGDQKRSPSRRKTSKRRASSPQVPAEAPVMLRARNW